MKRLFTTLILLLALAGCAAVGGDIDGRGGDIVIEDAWVRPAFVDGGNGAAFMIIRNTIDAPDALVGASAPFAERAELHQTVPGEQEGTMSMVQQERVQIPPAGVVTFEPGGYHVMLIGIEEQLEPGETVTVTLTFQEAGEVTVEAEVREE